MLGSGASKGQQPIDDRGLAPPPVIYGEPLPLFDSNRGADTSARESAAGCLAQGKAILAAPMGVRRLRGASPLPLLGSGASKGQQPIDDRGLAPPPVIYGEPLPLFDSNRGADTSARESAAGCLAQGKAILAAPMGVRRLRGASPLPLLGSGASKGQQPIDDRGLAPPPVIYGEPLPLFDSNRGADTSARESAAGCLAQGKAILAAPMGVRRLRGASPLPSFRPVPSAASAASSGVLGLSDMTVAQARAGLGAAPHRGGRIRRWPRANRLASRINLKLQCTNGLHVDHASGV